MIQDIEQEKKLDSEYLEFATSYRQAEQTSFRSGFLLAKRQDAERIAELKSQLESITSIASANEHLMNDYRQALIESKAKLDALGKQEPVGLFFRGDISGLYCAVEKGGRHSSDLIPLYAAPKPSDPAKEKQPWPNHNWCVGCSPDNCMGCGTEPEERRKPSAPAIPEGWQEMHIRQYLHNDRSGFVVGYNKAGIDAMLAASQKPAKE